MPPADWIASLPDDLRTGVNSIIAANDAHLAILAQLYEHLTADSPPAKIRKVSSEPEPTNVVQITTVEPTSTVAKRLSGHALDIGTQIPQEETIFELPQITFQSPIRKKMNLVFHLLVEANSQPKPVLSIVNPNTLIPEISLVHLHESIKLCVLLPILGNSTVSTKKNTGLLCFWLHDEAVEDPAKNDPIICQVNFDIIKRQLIKAGKIPPQIETQFSESQELAEGIKPINEAIIDFLQRQFKLCGINLINYLPSSNPAKNKLHMNTDSGIAVSQSANDINDLVVVEAYKGSKEGALVLLCANKFNPSYLIFGFKKPVLLFSLSKIKHISYSNITRLTFNVLVTIENEMKGNKEETIEFSMIDQKYHQMLDNFVKLQNINDNSFDDELREKKSNEAAAAEPAENAEGAEQPADSDDEEEDGTYTGAVEEDEEDSDVDEEFDSDANSGSDPDDDEEEDEGGEGEDDGVHAMGAEDGEEEN